MTTTRILTGITTSGTPHLGNYVGAIRPAVQASKKAHTDAFYFLADYHALIKTADPARVQRSRLEIAATWLASGLDPEQVIFYRQSDIPEIPELCWVLTCMTPKGLMNRAHAYKAAVDQNDAQDPDHGISMGLFSYPVLMAADILMFNAHLVPVGRDQIQHIEMARDIAQRFNHHHKRDYFVLPEAAIEESVATLPGLDGRKMSKSYDNTIPLFEGSSKELKGAISRIVTDSRLPGEPKDAENSHLYTIYRAFASAEQAHQFKTDLEQGLAWGDAKQQLFDLLELEIAPLRAHYQELIAKPDLIEDILQSGAQKARRLATPLMHEIRQAVGLGKIQVAVQSKQKTKKTKAGIISFKDETGAFRFRLLSATGDTLLLSIAYDNPKAIGLLTQSLKQSNNWQLDINNEQITLQVNEQVIAFSERLTSSDERVQHQQQVHDTLILLSEM